MKLRRRIHRNGGFTLVEFVVAIVFVGIVLGPFLLFVSRIHDLNNAMGQQGRREGWRSFNDEAVAAGINPALAPGFASTRNGAVPLVPPITVTTVEVAETPGLARIAPLRVVLDDTVAEVRAAGSGYQIGAGGSVSDPTTPTAPLAPIVMPAPTISPADGSVIAAAVLSPAGKGEPYTIAVQAASTAGSDVHLVLNQPSSTAEGFGAAQRTITAVDLLNRVNGIAWTEYPGNPGAGDRSIVLGDGRTRWLVTTPAGKMQIYEPSRAVTFSYQIGLGAPVLVHGASENASGMSLTFDCTLYSSVQTGAVGLKIDFPQAIKAVFGNGWNTDAIGFQCTFNSTPGPFSGDLGQFFVPDALPLWTDTVTINAAAVIPAGAAADPGTWALERKKTALGAPEMTSSADAAGFFSPGQMQFAAPVGTDGTRIGRLSFENGASLSTGPTLSIAVIP